MIYDAYIQHACIGNIEEYVIEAAGYKRNVELTRVPSSHVHDGAVIPN